MQMISLSFKIVKMSEMETNLYTNVSLKRFFIDIQIIFYYKSIHVLHGTVKILGCSVKYSSMFIIWLLLQTLQTWIWLRIIFMIFLTTIVLIDVSFLSISYCLVGLSRFGRNFRYNKFLCTNKILLLQNNLLW